MSHCPLHEWQKLPGIDECPYGWAFFQVTWPDPGKAERIAMQHHINILPDWMEADFKQGWLFNHLYPLYGYVPYLMILLVFIDFLRKRCTRELYFLSFALFSVSLNELALKRVVNQMRPEHSCLTTCGMPSGHSLLAMGYYVLTIVDMITRVSSISSVETERDAGLRRWKRVTFFLNALRSPLACRHTINRAEAFGGMAIWTLLFVPVPVSRVAVRDHTPTQVLAGSALGILVASSWACLVQYLQKKYWWYTGEKLCRGLLTHDFVLPEFDFNTEIEKLGLDAQPLRRRHPPHGGSGVPPSLGCLSVCLVELDALPEEHVRRQINKIRKWYNPEYRSAQRDIEASESSGGNTRIFLKVFLENLPQALYTKVFITSYLGEERMCGVSNRECSTEIFPLVVPASGALTVHVIGPISAEQPVISASLSLRKLHEVVASQSTQSQPLRRRGFDPEVRARCELCSNFTLLNLHVNCFGLDVYKTLNLEYQLPNPQAASPPLNVRFRVALYSKPLDHDLYEVIAVTTRGGLQKAKLDWDDQEKMLSGGLSFEQREYGKTQAFTFKEGPMGITCDDNGFVEEVRRGSQAFAHHILNGFQIVKVGAKTYSKDAVVQAEQSGADYEMTFKANVYFKFHLVRTYLSQHIVGSKTYELEISQSDIRGLEPGQSRILADNLNSTPATVQLTVVEKDSVEVVFTACADEKSELKLYKMRCDQLQAQLQYAESRLRTRLASEQQAGST